MARKDELSTITSTDLSSLIYSPIASEVDKPFSRDLYLTTLSLAGCQYVKGIEKRLEQIEPGERVTLLREPKNEHDELAIIVKDSKKRKLGYIPRRHNDVIARLMDAGKLLFGIVVDIHMPDEDEYPWRALTIEIYMED